VAGEMLVRASRWAAYWANRLQLSLSVRRHPAILAMSLRGVLFLGAFTAFGGQTVARAQACVALGYGHWIPAPPEWLPSPWFETPPHVRLHATPTRSAPYFQKRGWKAVGAAPKLGADSLWTVPSSQRGVGYQFAIGDVFAGWRAPQRDSLELRRLAALSWDVEIHGHWTGDTLRARAHTFSDARAFESEPRANAYGIRYPCQDRGRAAAADRALRDLLERDRPDSALARQEVRLLEQMFDSITGAAKARSRHR
jgi:hypothetical protein